MTVSAHLLTIIREATSRETPPPIRKLIEEILARYGGAVQAILFYGSCFRKGDERNGIVDLYLVVDNYRHAYRKYSHAFLNKLLPPNVFYIEVPYSGSVIRAKYSVFSFRDFQRGASRKWFQAYLWSRLAQPMGLVYARGKDTEEKVYAAMACAVLTFISRVLPLVPSPFTTRELWCKGFVLSYATELRAERRDKLDGLFGAALQHYESVTHAAMAMVSYRVEPAGDGSQSNFYRTDIPSPARIFARFLWALRRHQGKVLSILRLLKGLATFSAGLDYVLWKIERHSGVTVSVDNRLRKVPVAGVVILFWRLYRRGAFR